MKWYLKAAAFKLLSAMPGGRGLYRLCQERLTRSLILHFEVEPGTAEELKELDRVRIAACFQRYTREDLAARHLFFVARKN